MGKPRQSNDLRVKGCMQENLHEICTEIGINNDLYYGGRMGGGINYYPVVRLPLKI